MKFERYAELWETVIYPVFFDIDLAVLTDANNTFYSKTVSPFNIKAKQKCEESCS